jgi:hypothetical protein
LEFDTPLAAGQVGQAGRAIDVDLTPGMIDSARQNAAHVTAQESKVAAVQSTLSREVTSLDASVDPTDAG